MGRIRQMIAVDGRECWTLFDSGARNTYVIPAVADLLKTFSLKGLDGKTLSAEDLKGKVAVINVWGVWCSPCVKEMPQIQKLYDKYKADAHIAIVTIDSGDGTGILKSFLAGNKYTFPVLLESEYFPKSEVTAYPTTWFIDREGKIAFTKVGRTIDLENEFEWRIQALLEQKENK